MDFMDKIKKYATWCIVFLFVVLCTVLTVKSCHRQSLPQRTVYVTDTITSIQWDTVYQKEIRVEKFRVTDTLNQIVYRDSVVVDSVYVELPISQYHTDTTFHEGEADLYLCISASGYKVSLDTISYGLSYTIPQPKKRIRGGFFIGPMVGVGWTGGNQVSPSIGIGVGFGFSLKKY